MTRISPFHPVCGSRDASVLVMQLLVTVQVGGDVSPVELVELVDPVEPVVPVDPVEPVAPLVVVDDGVVVVVVVVLFFDMIYFYSMG